MLTRAGVRAAHPRSPCCAATVAAASVYAPAVSSPLSRFASHLGTGKWHAGARAVPPCSPRCVATAAARVGRPRATLRGIQSTCL
eukprot:361106-Chlamydomonas_euryale.AAC.2